MKALPLFPIFFPPVLFDCCVFDGSRPSKTASGFTGWLYLNGLSFAPQETSLFPCLPILAVAGAAKKAQKKAV
ncbi:hypothetical protein [Christensenella minuta]|uniref:hypothetical protein n=1 Tax=Christensenella minuta TaxID=626937 RepID=UPI0021572301|nr:hypothetical protein [Christensenella minuta]